ncbi:glycerophosphodiester phosphodiesterase family protein [Olivibacter sp. SDN3]|uniref:glycerophosphodiester phosphodiesterase family protein n=1 Tax=Olivibacter sp. SDN3 TaxID=2764720 RepID=UPI001651640D|nr:glycerophosphodiester phosphodiesterase family protein [Olivibacter sp. SDN3]QNL51493.1 glycerophosphodiester phosphodiesterase family protein [Olivibacter sp. SDN3]
MKNIFYLNIYVYLLIGACSFSTANSDRYNTSWQIKLKSTDDLYRFLTYHEQRVPLVSAHRGGPEPGYPENAIETFERSASKQPLIIECDIALSKDSVLVMMHDDKLDRTTTGEGFVHDYTLNELKQLHLKDNEGKETTFSIPTLDEVLNWGRGKVIFTLDVKRSVPLALVVDAVKRNKASAYSVIITYNATQASEVYQIAPDLMISASIKKIDDLIRLDDYGIPDNRLLAFVGVSEPDTLLYKQLHEHGIMCIIGTMGNLDNRAKQRGDDLYYKLITRGADIISTDRHHEAGVQLARYRKDHQLTLPK